jgi:hypothetical protein
MNEYISALVAAHNSLGDVGISEGCWHESNARFYITHTYRYLYWDSTGRIESLDGANTVGLSEPATGVGQIDLDSIDWLQYGQVYLVTGVTWCMEDWE